MIILKRVGMVSRCQGGGRVHRKAGRYIVLFSVVLFLATCPQRSFIVGAEETDCVDLMTCMVTETLAGLNSPLDLTLGACLEVCILLRLLIYGTPVF